jgi:hypothetical protein
MAQVKSVSNFEGLIQEIVASARNSRRHSAPGLAASANEVDRLTRLDYRAALRRNFVRSEIKELISEARATVWPRLNEQPVKVVSPREFTKHWASLGVEFKLARLSSGHGRALMGFYVRKTPAIKRPIICVNTAHHEAVIGAAFAHEMGHHLTAEMFGNVNGPQLMLYTGYEQHLEDPPELAADVLVSLGVLPFNVAKRSLKTTLCGRSGGNGENERDLQQRGILDYFAVRYGLKVDSRLSAGNRLQYLAGMIHYTKLREGLLEEYEL